MKKNNIFLGLAAALLLSACSSDELAGANPEQANRSQISFASPYVGKSNMNTRATGDLTSTNITSTTLKVWVQSYEGTYDANTATSIMEGDQLSFADGKWQYSGHKYWDGDKKHDFIAYAPANAAATANYSKGKLTLTGIPAVQVIANGDTKSGDDYLVSSTKTTTRGEIGASGVGLNFQHILSRLTFYVLSTENSYDVTLNSMKVYLPADDSSVSYYQNDHASPAGTWWWSGFPSVPSATSESDLSSGYKGYDVVTEADGPISVKQLASATKDAEAKMATEFFITPRTDASAYYLKVNYTVKVDQVDQVERTLDKFVKIDGLTTFEQGKQYNLLVNLNPSLITFDVQSDLDWEEEVPLECTAAVSGLHIEGEIDGYKVANTYHVSKLVKTGTTDNLLIRPTGDLPDAVQLEVEEDGHYRLSTQHINLDKLQSGVPYEMTMAVCHGGERQEEKTVGDLIFTFDEMNFTINPSLDETSGTFNVPLSDVDEMEDFSIGIAFGDNQSSHEMGYGGDAATITDAAGNLSRQHIYAEDDRSADKLIRILSTQTDRTKKQIPEFNFSKYPKALHDTNWEHNGGCRLFEKSENPYLLKSMGTPVLNSGATNLNGMFFDTKNMATVPDDLFSLYPNATEMRGIFRTRNSTAFTIPEGLFDKNTKVQYFDVAFNNRQITTLPASLFHKNTEVLSFASTFYNNQTLTSVPDGFFAKNLKACNFYETFYRCNMLVSFENMFIDDEQTKETRFVNLDMPLDISDIFGGAGLSNQPDAAANNAIDFRSYIFKPDNGFTWSPTWGPYSSTASFANQTDIDNLIRDNAEDCGGVAYPSEYR